VLIDDGVTWDDFYEAVSGREPRDETKRAIAAGPPGFAIELGCGDGVDTAGLLDAGWEVLAIDGERNAIRRVRELAAGCPRLATEVVRFEEIVDLPPADLVLAPYTLPFCPPDAFPRLWTAVRRSLDGGGRFSGNFFGPNDSWFGTPGLTFHARDDLAALFVGFDIEVLEELDDDGETADRVDKHWHVFSVMATSA
jgi:SAM-dependent methyltransferase